MILIYYSCLFVMLLNGFRRALMRDSLSTSPQTKPFPASQSSMPRPFVTLQIPVFNEKHVVRTILQSIPKLLYPIDRFEVQILDDSDDETTQMIVDEFSQLQALGYQMIHVRRTHRQGFKAGALNAGLLQAKGEFIAIFDADFVIHSEFLNQTLPHFSQQDIAFVQTPWSYTNARQNFLTQMQALTLTSHFEKEKPWRLARSYFFPFNGTAGIWRKSSLEAAGNWPEACLTEDLHVSVSCALKGYQPVYERSISCASELPDSYPHIKRQYERWAQGASQTLRSSFFFVLKSQQFSWPYKLDLLSYLGRHFIFAILMMWLLILPWVIRFRPAGSIFNFIDVLILALTSLFTLLFFKPRFETWKPKHLQSFFVISFIGLSLVPSQTLACFKGLLTKDTLFIRTPKKGARVNHTYASPADTTLWFEIAFASYYWICFVSFFMKDFWGSKPLLIWNGLALSFSPLNFLYSAWIKPHMPLANIGLKITKETAADGFQRCDI